LYAVKDENGDIANVVCINGDITELKKSEEQLIQAEHRYRTVADFTYDWEYWKNPDGTFLYVSPSCERISGYKPEEFINNPEFFRELILPEDKTRWDEHHQKVLKEKGLQEIQFRIHKQDGQTRWIEHVCQPVTDEKGKFLGFRASNRDITARKQAEEDVTGQAKLLNLILKNSLDSIVLLDKDYNFIWVNETYAKACQRDSSEFAGHNHFEFYPSNLKEEFDAAKKGKSIYRKHARPFIFPDHPEWGTTYWDLGLVPIFDDDGEIEMFLFTLKNITKRKKAEEQLTQIRSELFHASRIGTMGELTAALAHEINHPLGSILNNANAARRYLEQDDIDLDEIRDIINDIISEDRRATGVMQKVRNLMKKTEVGFAPVQINVIIEEVLGLTHSEFIIENVSLSKQLEKDLPQIAGERIQLQQVFINLIMNAIDAMKESKMKKLHVSTAQHDAENIIICLKDSGTGIDESKKDSLFKPFFTTKKKGMGMGLSVTRTIINSHRGDTWAENNKEAGASFFVKLPIYKERSHEQS
jgi:PAS domain S-box-containing protein